MRKTLAHSFLILGFSAFLFGCEVGPDYEKPQTSLPGNWKSADDTAPNAGKDEQATIEQSWWKSFNDPVLSKLIDQSLTGNYDLKIAQARIAEARASRATADSALWPQGDVKGSAERVGTPSALSLPGLSSPFNIYQTGFDASWELDLFGGNKRAVEEATYNLQASEASFSDVRVSMLAEVARTYVDIRQYQAQLKVAQDTVAIDQDTLSIAKQRADAGTAPGIDVTQAEAQLEQSRAEISAYQSQLNQAEFSMDVLLGEQPGAAVAIIGNTKPIPMANKKLILAAPAVVIDNRPDIHMAERKLAAATAQQGVATAQFYPDISLTGFLGLLSTNGGSLFTGASKLWYAESSVVWPILSYGKLQANLDSADAAQQEALATYQKTIVSALSDVEKSVTAYTQQGKFDASYSKSVAKNQHASVIAKQRYKEGLTSFIEALDADRTLYASQIQLAQADGDATRDLISVYKSLGGGWKPEAAVAVK